MTPDRDNSPSIKRRAARRSGATVVETAIILNVCLLFLLGLFVPSTPVLLLTGGLIAHGELPFWPICTAACGTVTTSGSSRRVTATETKRPGHSRSAPLAKTARSAMVPVPESIALSKKASSPSTGGPSSPEGRASTFTGPAAIARRIAGSSLSATENST